MATDAPENRPSLCMACRKAPARYFGIWAQEGLCRRCILRMPPDIQAKVLRDMHPADRKRWQVDELFKRDAGVVPKPSGAPPEGLERAVSRLLEATESSSPSRLEEEAEKSGVKVLEGGDPPPKS